MKKARREIIAGNAISEIVLLKLGGYEQKVLIEGLRLDLPVVVTLHGGPGMPIPFSVGARGLFPEFTNRFIMVYWDQLGCGINNYKIDESFRIKNFVDMTIDLVHEIKKRFPDNKLILFATSWGSILSLEAAHCLKDEIHSVFVMGQITKLPISNTTALAELDKSRMPLRKKRLAHKYLENPITPEAVKFLAGCIRKYTNGYTNKEGKKAPIGSMILGILQSPDYNFKDIRAIVKNGTIGNRSIWEDIIRNDFSKKLTSINIPYIIIQGDTDIVTDTDYLVKLVNASGNSYLSYKVIEKCGHLPGADAINAILEEASHYIK